MSKVNIITKHAPWVSYKTVTASEDALSVTSRKGANVPIDAYTIPEAMNNVEMRVSATTGANNIQATIYFYGARYLSKGDRSFDDISLIGSAVLTTGQQISTHGYAYVDTVVLTDKWITDVKVADGSAGDGMSRLAFDASGYDVFFVKMTYIVSTNWLVEISGW